MKRAIRLPLLVAFLLAAAAPSLPAASPIDGVWRVEIPQGKIDEFVFDFQCVDGTLTGEVQRGDKGTEEISSGKCSPESFEFQVNAGKDVWLWSGTAVNEDRFRCRRKKQGKKHWQSLMANR